MTGIINYQEGIFLGRAELEKQQEMMRALFLSEVELLREWTLSSLKNLADISVLDGKIRVSSKSVSGIPLGVALDGGIITIPGKNDIPAYGGISSAGSFEVYLISYNHSFEKGTVTIDKTGYATGNGTVFRSLFRNAASGRFSKFRTEDGNIHLVQSVISDTTMQLYNAIDQFKECQDSQFEILPTISPFFKGNDSKPLYSYDSSSVVLGGTEGIKIATVTISGSAPNWTLGSITWEE